MTSAYGRLLTAQGRYEEAESQLLAALGVLERDHPPDDQRTWRTRAFLVELHETCGRPEEAAEYRRR